MYKVGNCIVVVTVYHGYVKRIHTEHLGAKSHDAYKGSQMTQEIR